MKIKSFALVLFIVLACLMITPVMAETLTGELGAEGWNSTTYNIGGPAPFVASKLHGMYIQNFENSGSFKSLVNWNLNEYYSFDAGAPPGAQTQVTVRIANGTGDGTGSPMMKDGRIVGTGQIGYQRYYNTATPPVEQKGAFVYVYMDSWDTGNETGLQHLYIEYDSSLLYNLTVNDGAGAWAPTNCGAFEALGNGVVGEAYVMNKEVNTYASYTTTKPSGLGISGTVNKTREGGVLFYNSRAFIFNVNGTVITSDTNSNPSPFYFNVPVEQIKIGILTPNSVWYNSSTLFNLSTSVTPTPTPIAGAVYTMTTSTDYVNVSGTNTATIASLTDPSLADLKYIGAFLSDTPSGAQSNFFEAGSTVHALSYTLVGGTWYGYDSADVDYNNAKGGIPNPLTLKWDTTSGDKTLHVTLQNSAGDYTYLTRTIHVGQGTQTLIQTRAQAMDGTNGGSLGMVAMQIYNHNTQTWTNLSPNDGLGSVITPPNTILSFYAQKAGFSSGTLLNQPARSDLIYSVNLFIGPTVGTGYSNHFVTVKDAQGFPIGGAQIILKNTVTGLDKIGTSSASGGSQIFNLTNLTLYTWTVTKTGYGTRSGSFTTGASGSSGFLEVIMSPAVTPTKTTLPIPTGAWTVVPGATTQPGNTTFWLPWKNVFSMMGASNTEQPLLIAGLIVVLCMAAGAGMAGVLGAEVMMGFGAILCVALGLIPIWVVLAIIVIGFLFYGLKIGGK